MNAQTSQNIIKKLFDSCTSAVNKEEAINNFLTPRRGRPNSNDVVIKTLLDFCHEKLNCSEKKDWKEVVEVAVEIVKTIKNNSSQAITKTISQDLLAPPQFGQKQVVQKQVQKKNYRKEVDGSFTMIYENGYTKTFTKKQMDFFVMISREYSSL